MANITNEPITIVRDTKLVEERIHQREEQHVQPIVQRDIEQKVVKQVLQPMHETTVLPTERAVGQMAGEERIIDNDRVVAPVFVPEAQVVAGTNDVNIVQHAPIVEERYHKQIIEEVQPILYRDVIQKTETVLTQNIHEQIINAPVVVQETRGIIEVGGTSIPVAPVQEVIVPVVEPVVVPVVPVEPVIIEKIVEVEKPVYVDRVVEVVRPVAVAPPPATAAFAVIPDGVPVVHDGKIVNAGLGGHDAGQAIRPVESGLQTHSAIPGTVGHSKRVKNANETKEEKKARKAHERELKKQETAEAKAHRQAAKEAKRREKRPHETKEQRKARKASGV